MLRADDVTWGGLSTEQEQVLRAKWKKEKVWIIFSRNKSATGKSKIIVPAFLRSDITKFTFPFFTDTTLSELSVVGTKRCSKSSTVGIYFSLDVCSFCSVYIQCLWLAMSVVIKVTLAWRQTLPVSENWSELLTLPLYEAFLSCGTPRRAPLKVSPINSCLWACFVPKICERAVALVLLPLAVLALVPEKKKYLATVSFFLHIRPHSFVMFKMHAFKITKCCPCFR